MDREDLGVGLGEFESGPNSPKSLLFDSYLRACPLE